MVIIMFPTEAEAEAAIHRFIEAGHSPHDISMVKKEPFTMKPEVHAAGPHSGTFTETALWLRNHLADPAMLTRYRRKIDEGSVMVIIEGTSHSDRHTKALLSDRNTGQIIIINEKTQL